MDEVERRIRGGASLDDSRTMCPPGLSRSCIALGTRRATGMRSVSGRAGRWTRHARGVREVVEAACQRWNLRGLGIRDLEILGTGSWTLGGRDEI